MDSVRQNSANGEGLVTFSQTMAGVGHVKRIHKDAFGVAGTVQETYESDMSVGQGADFLRGAAYWPIKSLGFL